MRPKSDNLKIAFVTEPMPVRTGSKYCQMPFDIFSTAADSIQTSGLATTYLIATDELISNSGANCNKFKGSDLGFNQEWPNDWCKIWPSFIDAVEINTFNKCREFFSKESIDVVFICDKHDTIRAAAIDAGAKVVHIAQGPLRSPIARFWLVDPDGIGPDSMISKRFYAEKHQSIAEEEDSLFRLIDASVVKRRSNSERLRVLIALQPDDDIPSLVWNKFGSQEDFLKDIVDAIKIYDNIDFILRQHPNDTRNYEEFINNNAPFCKYDDGKVDIWSIIGTFDAVINISSTLSSEATLTGSHVLTLGKNLFNKGADRKEYRNLIVSFINEISHNKNKNIFEFYQNFSYIMERYLVEENYIYLPSFYLSLSSQMSRSGVEPGEWFDAQCGLKKVTDRIYKSAIMQDIYQLKRSNYLKDLEIDRLRSSESNMRSQIDSLMAHNHFRILEIESIKSTLSIK